MTGRDWTTWISCSPSAPGIRYSMDFLESHVTSSASYGLPIPPDRLRQFQYPTPSPSQRYSSSRSRSASPPCNMPLFTASATGGIPLPQWNSPMSHPKLVTVDTNFNPTLEHNAKMRYQRHDKQLRFKFTEIHRKKAQSAINAVNLDDFSLKVIIFANLMVSN